MSIPEIFRSFGILCKVDCLFVTDVSGNMSVQSSSVKQSTNLTLRSIPKERRSHLHCDGRLNLRMFSSFFHVVISLQIVVQCVLRVEAEQFGKKKEGKPVPLQARGAQRVTGRFPDYVTMAQDGGKFVSLTHRPPLPPGNTPGTHFCWRLSRPQAHSAIGEMMSMKNSNDTSWDRTSDLPICSPTS